MIRPGSGVTATPKSRALRSFAVRAAGAVVACGLALGAAACGRAAQRPAEVLPNHAWRTVSGSGGPTYTFRASEQVEVSRAGTTLSGTYKMPTDSTLVVTATGYVPGLGAGGPTTLTLRFDVRVLPPQDARERVEFRSGMAADTLARVD